MAVGLRRWSVRRPSVMLGACAACSGWPAPRLRPLSSPSRSN